MEEEEYPTFKVTVINFPNGKDMTADELLDIIEEGSIPCLDFIVEKING